MSSDGITLALGDLLKIERRLLVEGVVTAVTDEGEFAGVQSVGSAEHLVIEDGAKCLRLFPLHAISEITIVKAVARQSKPVAPSWDPGVA